MTSSDCPKSLTEADVEGSGPKFDPPLFKQRYFKVRQILHDDNITKVADFGCAEGKFLWFLKNSSTIQDVAVIDVQESILYRTGKMASPLMWDHVFKRKTPLRIKVYQGSIADCDSRIQEYEAITCIELIEHLEDSVLKKLPEVVFGFLRPRLAVFTTPNVEFNVLFPSTKGFRHWDHKFEWTRKELQQWGDGIVKEYADYSVCYDGVGDPPVESQHVGHCSQIAIFRRKSESSVQSDSSGAEEHIVYKLLEEHQHPCQ